MTDFSDKVSFIWSVADLLRGPYKPAQYGRVILPLTVLRRLDCVLEPTKEKVLAKAAELKSGKVANTEPILNRTACPVPLISGDICPLGKRRSPTPPTANTHGPRDVTQCAKGTCNDCHTWIAVFSLSHFSQADAQREM